MQFYDAQIYKSFTYMLKNPNEVESLSLTFAVQEENEVVNRLVEDGENVAVTKQNLNEYIGKMIKYYSLMRA